MIYVRGTGCPLFHRDVGRGGCTHSNNSQNIKSVKCGYGTIPKFQKVSSMSYRKSLFSQKVSSYTNFTKRYKGNGE